MSEAKKKVLMVCLGNICRSPIAEAVFENEVNKRGLQDQWEVESAAVMGYHTGVKAFVTPSVHPSIKPSDFNEYDWIFGMDHDNIEDLNKQKPENCRAKVELLGSYDPSGNIIIRDPYYDSNSAEFQTVYDQCLASVTAFLNKYTS